MINLSIKRINLMIGRKKKGSLIIMKNKIKNKNRTTKNRTNKNKTIKNRATKTISIKMKKKIGGMEPMNNKIENKISITVTILDNTKKKNTIIATYNNVLVNVNDDIIESIYLIDNNTYLDKKDKISVVAKDNYIFSTETYQQKELSSGDTILVNINKKIESKIPLTQHPPTMVRIPPIYQGIEPDINKNVFRILTHNIGGQSKIIDSDIPEFVVSNRGHYQWSEKYNSWVDKLNLIPKDLYPNSINIPSDIYCFQEFIMPLQPREDLAYHIPKRGKDYFIINKGSFRLHNLTLELHNIETQSQSSIELYNLHGRVLSPTTSFYQLQDLLELLSDINNSSNGYYKMIIGDFNFDFHAYYNNYLIYGIPYQQDMYHIIETIITNTHIDILINKYPQYQYQFKENNFYSVINPIFDNINYELHQIYENFIICPHEWIPTNTWKINDTNTQRHTCIDYLLISKSLSTIIDSILYQPYWEYKVSSIDELEDRHLMMNDFDHVPILFTLLLKDNYKIIY